MYSTHSTRLLARIIAGFVLLMASGCGRAAGPGTPGGSSVEPDEPPRADSVNLQLPFILPDQAPDSSPPDLRAELDPEWRAPVDIMAVGFRTGLSRVRKTRLVVEVGGIELVGGAPLDPIAGVDGIYLIRIRTDGTMSPLLEAVRTLNASPDVVRASPLLQIGGTR